MGAFRGSTISPNDGFSTSEKERAIRALKFVKVATSNGYLTDVSIAMLLVEMERRGVVLDNQ